MYHTKQFTIKKGLLETQAYRNFTLGLFSFLIAFLVASTFVPVHNSDASTVTITNNTSDFFIQITSADNLALDVTASPTGQLAYAADTLNIITNSPNGYHLYLSTSNNDNNIYLDGDSATSSQGYFGPTTGTIASPAALLQNTWGFALSKVTDTSSSKYNPLASTFADISDYVNYTGSPTENSTWAGVPTFANSQTAKISELSTSNSPDGNDLDIYYGINASTTLPDGTYSTEITYTAISEGVNKFPTMQDFTAEQCYNMATDTSINLSDVRDDKYYRVTKMKDGHCWMTDNLALDGTDASGNVRVLTPSDSNVTTNRPLAANIENGTASEYDVVQIYSGVANGVTRSCDLTTYPYCIVNTTTKYGNLYNWNAATAGVGKQATTGTVTESICPKGWQLPDNDNTYSYTSLLRQYNILSMNTTDGNAVKAAQASPLYFTLSGYYEDEEYQLGQTYSSVWSRTVTAETTDRAYRFSFNAEIGAFYPQNNVNHSKATAVAVRCVFSGQSTDPTMQDFTTTQCNNLATNASTVLIDRRNNQFYRVVHAQDGNCWMADNLSIYNQTISAADSDFSSGTYTLPASITTIDQWSSGIYETPMLEVAHGLGDKADTSGDYYGQVYYNWCAATATTSTTCTTTSTSSTSICPANWRLPINGDNSTSKTYTKLLDAYSITTSAQLIANDTLGFKKYYGFWSFVNKSEYSQGSQNYFMSSTPSSSTTIYSLYYAPTSISPQSSGGNKGAGFSIRCILR